MITDNTVQFWIPSQHKLRHLSRCQLVPRTAAAPEREFILVFLHNKKETSTPSQARKTDIEGKADNLILVLSLSSWGRYTCDFIDQVAVAAAVAEATFWAHYARKYMWIMSQARLLSNHACVSENRRILQCRNFTEKKTISDSYGAVERAKSGG